MSYDNNRRRNQEPAMKDLANDILVKPIDIGLDSPPFVPRISVPSDLRDYFPELCASLAMSLQDKRELTRAHTFLYNVAADNDFDTEVFEKLVAKATNAVDCYMRKFDDLTIEKAIQRICDDVVDGTAAKNAESSRELQRFIPDEEWTDLKEMLNAYDDIIELTGESRGRGDRDRGRDSGRYSQRAGGERSYGGRRVRAEAPATDSGRRYGGSRSNSDRPVSANEALGLAKEVPVERAPQGRGRVREVEPSPTVAHSKRVLAWTPTPRQPYLPLRNIATTDARLEVGEGGVVTTFVKKDTVVEDYATHATTMGARATYTDPVARRVVIENELKAAEKEAVSAEHIILNSDDNPPLHRGSICTFLMDAVLTYISKYDSGKRGIGAVSSGGLVYSRVLSGDNGEKAVPAYEWLASSRNFEMLGQRLGLLLANNHDRFKLSGSQARKLDADMTASFNRILHRQLSIGKDVLELESFSENIAECITILERHKNLAAILPALRKAESEFIINHTLMLKDQGRMWAVENYETAMMPRVLSDKDKENIELSAYPALAVLIAVNANELAIDIEMGQTCALVLSEHKQLTTLVSTLVDSVNPLTNTRSRIMLSTLDGYRFELDKGLLGDHFYLITRCLY